MNAETVKLFKIATQICLVLSIPCFFLALTGVKAWQFAGVGLFLAALIVSMVEPTIMVAITSTRILFLISVFSSFTPGFEPIIPVFIPVALALMLLTMLMICDHGG